MKMILATMPTHLSDLVSRDLLDESYRVTKFASTAGLLSGGITTLMIIAPAVEIPQALDMIRNKVHSTDPADPAMPRATIYVLKVKDFEKV